jgi:hypothetical protein
VKLFLCSRKICSVKRSFSFFCPFVFGSQSLPHCIKNTVLGFNFEGSSSYFLSHSVTCFCLQLCGTLCTSNNIFHKSGDEEFMQKLLLKAIFYSKTFPLLRMLANAIPCFSRQHRRKNNFSCTNRKHLSNYYAFRILQLESGIKNESNFNLETTEVWKKLLFVVSTTTKCIACPQKLEII